MLRRVILDLRNLLLFVLAVSMIGLNMVYFKSVAVGFLAFILYVSSLVSAICKRFTFFERALRPFFGFLFLCVLILLITTPLILLRIVLSDQLIFVLLLIPSLLFFSKTTENKSNMLKIYFSSSEAFIIFLLFILIIPVFYLLWSVRTSETIMSPREVFPQPLYFCVLLASFYVSLLIFTKFHTYIRLFAVVLHSLAVCSFGYLVYEYMYSSDLWEYLSIERWISLGGVLPYRSTFIKYIMDGNNLHVGLYSLNIIFSKLLQLDLYWLTLLSVALLLSVCIPLLMYQIGKKIYNNDVYALTLAYFPSFLYDTLIWRSLSSANGLGVLITLFALLFWITYLTDEHMPLLFPILITGDAILAYPLTGIIAAEFVLVSIFLKRYGTKRRSKTLTIVSTVSLILPIILLMSGTCTLASIRPWENVLSRFIYPSERSSLNRLLDLPYMFVYVMVIYGLLIGRKNIKSEVYTMLSAFLVILMSNSIFTDLANMPTLRVTTTILPYFYLFFAGIAIRELDDKCTMHIHVSSTLRTKRLRISTLKLSAIVISFMLALGPSAIYFFMPYRGPNPSRHQIEAINYILNEDKAHSSLILADYLTLMILNAEANGSWYGLPPHQTLYTLTELVFPTYKKLMRNPSYKILIEARNAIEEYLRECGVNATISHYYIVYDTVISKIYGLKPEQSLSQLENLFGKPKVFGNVFLFSGYIPKNSEVNG